MPLLLSVRSLAKSFGARELFRGVSFSLSDRDRVGLIGPNGSGKSTLLKILAGLEHEDEGDYESRRKLRIGYVAQEPVLPDELSVEDAIAGEHVSAGDDRLVRARILISKIGLRDSSQLVGELSGGARKRVAIAQQLVDEPDLLLMDEPTNHLDYDGIRWLERMLSSATFATLLVSHDRAFLEAVTNRTIELDRAYPDGLLSVDGSYSKFVERRAEFLEAQAGQERAVASRVRREVEWLQRGAKARTTKAKGRIQAADELKDQLADLKSRNAAAGSTQIEFAGSARQTRKLLQLRKVSKSLGGRKLLSNVNITLGPGSTLGILGANGAGKSTLLKLMIGALEPDSGEVIRAEHLNIATFDQHREQLDLSLTLRRALAPMGDNLSFRGGSMHITAWARRFLFRDEQLDMPLAQLSGGEQSRVLIANLMLIAADVLILDEPTNDLDIPTLDVLEESLAEFPGAVVLVTHDRFMLDRVSNGLLWLEGGEAGGTVQEFASLAQWEKAREQKTSTAPRADAATANKSQSAKPNAGKAGRLTWKEQRELEGFEAAIEQAENAVAEAEREAALPATLADHLKARAAFEALGAAQSRVVSLYERWTELEAKQAT